MVPRRGVLIGAVCAFGLAAGVASAAPGDLDPSFGNGGIVALGDDYSWASDLLIDPRRRLIVSGVDRGSGPALFRFRRNGALDRSYSGDGRRLLDPGDVYPNQEMPIVRQADGKIVVGFALGYEPPTIGLARLNRDGTLDGSFGDGGVARTGVPLAGYPWTLGIDVAADRRMVAAGPAPCTCPTGAGGGLLIARFLADGSVDKSFADDGSKVIRGEEFSSATSVEALRHGGIVAAGTLFDTGLTVVKLHRSGAFDDRFSGDGIAVPYPGRGVVANDLTLGARGRLVLAGEALCCNSDFVLRLNRGGARDPSFGHRGVALAPWSRDGTFDSSGTFTALGLDSAGRIAVAGSTYDPDTGAQSEALTRYRSNGELAASFGEGGTAQTLFGDDAAAAAAIAIQPDGKIVTAGSSLHYEFRSEFSVLSLARYLVSNKKRR